MPAPTYPQTVLQQLLKLLNADKDRLSTSERSFTERICFCVACNWYWVRRFRVLPARCPHCHSRSWDRPLLAALLNAERPKESSPNAHEA